MYTFCTISRVCNICILLILHLQFGLNCNGFEIEIDDAETLLSYNGTTDCEYYVLLEDMHPERNVSQPPDTLTKGFWSAWSGGRCDISIPFRSFGWVQSTPIALTIKSFVQEIVSEITVRCKAYPDSGYQEVGYIPPTHGDWTETSFDLESLLEMSLDSEIHIRLYSRDGSSQIFQGAVLDKITFTFMDQATAETVSTYGPSSEQPPVESTQSTSEPTTEHFPETTTLKEEALIHIDTSEDMSEQWINTCTYQKYYFHYQYQSCPMLASDENAFGWNGTGFWSSCNSSQCIIAHTISGRIPTKIEVFSFVAGSASIRISVRVGATVAEVKSIKNSNWQNVVSYFGNIKLLEGSIIMLQPSGYYSLANINLIGRITLHY